MTEYSPAKFGEYLRIFPNIQNFVRCEKDLKDNKHNSLYLGRKDARIFVLEHYLFLVAMLSENCLLLGTDNVCKQNPSIFLPNGGYCLYILVILLDNLQYRVRPINVLPLTYWHLQYASWKRSKCAKDAFCQVSKCQWVKVRILYKIVRNTVVTFLFEKSG